MKNKGLKIFKFLGITLIGLLLAVIMFPFVFKQQIKDEIKKFINDQVNAEVQYGDVDLTLYKSFPDLRLSIKDLSIKGIDAFEGINLYTAKNTSIDIDIMSLIQKDRYPEINDIRLQEPKINLIVVTDSINNYNIMKSSENVDSTETMYKLSLKKFFIEDGFIQYDNRPMQFFTKFDGLGYEMKGDFTQAIFDLKTKLQSKSTNIKYDGIQYIKDAKVNFTSDINMDFEKEKYTLLNNAIAINELDIMGEGFVQFIKDDINTQLRMTTKSEKFKSLLSILPAAYTPDFKDVKADGNAKLDIAVDGTYSAAKNQLPSFDFKMDIDKGYVKYPNLPNDISNINAKVQVKAARPDHKDMSVVIPAFTFDIGKDYFKGAVVASNLSGDQKAKGNIDVILDLTNLKNAYPLEGVEIMKGLVNAKISFDANMSDVENEKYENIDFKGDANVDKLVVKLSDKPTVSANQLKFDISPSQLNISSLDMQMGKSDLNFNMKLSNPLVLLSTTRNAKITFDAFSNILDMNEWHASTPTNNQSVSVVDNTQTIGGVEDFFIDMNYKANKVLFDAYTYDQAVMKGRMANDIIEVNQLEASIQGSDISINGVIKNGLAYLFGNGVLEGQLHMTSKKFNANTFMSQDPNQATTTNDYMPIPENIMVDLHTKIGQLVYTNLTLDDFQGVLKIRANNVELHEVSTKTLGGQIALDGVYSMVEGQNPDFSMKLDLAKIRFADAFKSFETFRLIAPISEFIQGVFNTTLIMRGKLTNNMTPELSSIDASGFIQTITGNIKGFKPVQDLSNMLGLTEISEVSLLDSKNWFEINDGTIEIKPFDIIHKEMNMVISGSHSIGKEMNYLFEMAIPRKLLQQNKITKTAESGLSIIEKEAKKLGVNIEQGETIYLDVIMKGTIKSPRISIMPKASKGKSVSNIIESKANEAVETIKDSIKNEVNKQTGNIRDSLKNLGQQEFEKGKEKVISQSEKILDSLKRQATDKIVNKIDTLTKGVVSDTLKQVIKDKVGEKSQEEINKIKDKLKDYNPFKKKN